MVAVLSYTDVEVGTQLPEKQVTVSRLAVLLYGGQPMRIDFAATHWSERIAHERGLPDIILHGSFTLAKTMEIVNDWSGDPAASLESVPAGEETARGPALTDLFHRTLQARCQEGCVYFHPDPHRPWFLSTKHTVEDIDAACSVIAEALAVDEPTANIPARYRPSSNRRETCLCH